MMWCTRWYLPLVLLPMPVAPPYFLLLFLISTTMHARPCFYCMVLLSAMFMSTCYWPPVSTETPLARPWAENVTTFADAIHSLIPGLPKEDIPETIPIADRCWCDLSNGFFAPFNVTRWEEISVVRLKDSLEKEMAAEKMERDKQACEGREVEDAATCAEVLKEPHYQNATVSEPAQSGWEAQTRIWNVFRAFKHTMTPTQNLSSAQDSTASPLPSSNMTSAALTDAKKSSDSGQSKSWLRREYDMRHYGFAMVLDFGWPDVPS